MLEINILVEILRKLWKKIQTMFGQLLQHNQGSVSHLEFLTAD